MRFNSLFSACAAVIAVSAATNSSEIAAITQALEHGDFIDAAIDILTLGSCDVDNIADCVSGFAPIVIDCGEAAVAKGANSSEDLSCFKDALDAIGSTKFGSCADCIEEGISIAQSLISTI